MKTYNIYADHGLTGLGSFEDFSNKVITDDVLARLLSFNNVMVTSHQGFFTQEALQSIASTTLENIGDFFTQHKLSNEICYKCGA